MKNRFVFILLATLIFSGCGPASSPAPGPTETPKPVETPAPVATLTFPPTTTTPANSSYPSLPREASWQIQYTGEELDTSLDVDVFNLDLFDTSSATFETLRNRGVFVMCYFSAGSYEDWRPDASSFPDEVLGKDMEGWPGEKWLDIRRIDLLAPIIEARLELAVEKQCDGVDPDNINGYTNDTGFPLTAGDQIAFNLYLSEAAHQRGLAIGLKNDLEQIPELVSHFDWIINEECFSYGECELLLPFAQAGKPIFVIEYELQPADFCTQAVGMGFNALHKNWELDAYRVDCRQFSGQ
ncbi:MAG: endo alpha-1,4 polygalactosaminidase [Chloroflexi bacterium HGW-Chloroflexi-6]|nr:MAG: endo alpha-1,4 polygalactosaminidase [Chloroflexi bacterium HGW-Chloroflexi-6]